MMPNNGGRSLADALNAGSGQQTQNGGNPLVDRLATALAVTHAEDDFDDADDELDLPMLVQGERYGAIVPLPPVQRIREGRAALIGFGLGLVLLVPIGVVMSGRVSDLPPPPATSITTDASVIPTIASLETALAPQPQPAPASTFSASVTEVVPPRKETVAEAFSPPPAPVAQTAISKVSPVETTLAEAQDMISHGEIDSARASLRALGAEHEPAVMMLLAETYDPNMLAAWSARGAAPDVATARSLYQRALALGQAQARQRLQGLD